MALCGRCGGHGKITCTRCNGSCDLYDLFSGTYACPKCDGSGKIECPRCDGSCLAK